MPNIFLCDTCLFLSLWKLDEITSQRVYGEQFFDLVKNCVIDIYSANVVDLEFKYRWREHYRTYRDFCNELRRIKAGKIVVHSFTPTDHQEEILAIQEDAKQVGIKLSPEDVSLILISNELNIPIVSFDHGIIDYCTEKNYKAYYPVDIINRV